MKPRFAPLLSAVFLFGAYALPAGELLTRDKRVEIGAGVRVAEVDEASATRVIWVNQSAPGAGDDAVEGRGGERLPFRSITAAAEAMRAALSEGVGVRMRIAPGIYREDLSQFIDTRRLPAAALTPPLVVEGTEPEGVVLSGAVERLGDVDFSAGAWRAVPGRPGVFEHEWPYHWGVDAGPWADNFGVRFEGLAQRRELIVIDGKRLRQVEAERYRWDDPDGPAYKKTLADPLAPRPPANQPGVLVYQGSVPGGLDALDAAWTFCVFDQPESPAELRGRIFVRLPSGEKLDAGRRIEVALLAPKGRSLLRIGRKDNVVLRNLTLRHANPGFTFPALLAQGNNILIENVRTVENDGRGMQLEGERITVRRSVARDNGQKGIGFTGAHFVLEDTDASFNNQRGVLGGFLGWDSAGIKAAKVSHVVLRRVTAVGNRTGGVWFDVACADILVEDCFFYGNDRPGLEFEFSSADRGGYAVRRSVMAGNLTCGLFISDVRDTRVERNLIAGNTAGLLELEPSAVQIAFKNFNPRGPDAAAQWGVVELRGNVIESPRGAALIGFQNRKTTAGAWRTVLGVIDAADNRYAAPAEEADKSFENAEGVFTGWEVWREMLRAAGRESGAAFSPETGSRFVAAERSANAADAFPGAFAPGGRHAAFLSEIGLAVPSDLLARHEAERRARVSAKDRTDG